MAAEYAAGNRHNGFVFCANNGLTRLSGSNLLIFNGQALPHFATVFGLMPGSWLSSAIKTCDHCIAILTACVVVALP